jgi:putative flippase GtrA
VEIEPRRAEDGGGHTRLHRLLLAHQVTKFLVVGVLSYAADIAVLYVAHGRAHLALWLATSIAYACGLLANFALNRVVTFRSTAPLHRQMGRYAALLVANYLVTLALVTGLTAAGLPYLGSKTICVALLAIVNFAAYRHWVFSDDAA